jgi:hypothetical protein
MQGTVVPATPAAPSPEETAATAASAVALLGSARGCAPLLTISGLHVRAQQASAPESPRMTRLKQLQYDRRPSTILKAWTKQAEARRKDAAIAAADFWGTAPLYAQLAVAKLVVVQNTPRSKSKAPDTPAKSPLDIEVDQFQNDVTLGNWPAVKTYLAGLPLAEGKAAYKQLLQSLRTTPGAAQGPMMMGPGGMMPAQRPELNAVTVDDVIGLAAAVPRSLDQELLGSLGAILRRALDGYAVAPDVVARFKAEVGKGTGKGVFTARQAAQTLTEAGEPVSAGAFLPSLDKAMADKDSEGLNLLARHFVGLYAIEKKVVFHERAWAATQAVLALPASKVEEKEEAVRRAVELAPKIKEELGQVWLNQSFTSHPERGIDILATIGSLASQGLLIKPMVPDDRLKVLQLQKTAVEALLKAAPGRAAEWRSTLTLLAGVWMREAEYTQQMDRSGSQMRSGRFGRYWMYDDQQYQMMMRQQNMPMPIATAELIRTRPEKGWISNLDNGGRGKLSEILARLYLKADDENKAFPFIEELALTHKEAARELVNEFLRVWTTNHDPNAMRQYANPYYFWYPWEMRAEGIPLTRSKQERNLVDLAGWVDRMRRLPLDGLDEDLLVDAFTKCHSSAEVYRLDAIEKVFGPLAKIKPRTLAGLIQKTRENLAGLWREPAEQQKQKTNRKQKDIQVEVLRGYALADAVVGNALKQFPDDWSLTLARAALLHDETNYRQEVAKSSDYAQKRDKAMTAFQKAAALYGDQVKRLSEDEESIAVYQQWFHASLGACDVSQLDDEKLPDPQQAPLIGKAIRALPGELAERHLNKLAASLVTDLRRVKATAKHRYLKQGFAIIGDNKEAADAKKIYDYYKDLNSEIKLEVVIDGSDRVGYKQPFGVFVNIRHTREIERESGGFGRYLQNQSSMLYSYNFGRPPADYRDRFQAAATEALKEQFEVMSTTFQTDKVHSRATQEYGWRVTPYAYLLLKPRGPQVDKIPPLHLDLDFADTTYDFSDYRRASGYVILPVESAAVPISATSEKGEPRPVRKLQITQILDERQADRGKLGLEIKATAVGLVGSLDNTLNLAPEGFEVQRVDDQGVSIAKFDEDGEGIAVVSERTWLVSLGAKQDRAKAPSTFRFAAPRVECAEMTYQRYQDADLATAQAEISLEHEYRGRGQLWLWAVGSASTIFFVVMILVVIRLLRRRPRAAVGMQLPETLTPFTVTALLRHIQQTGRVSPDDTPSLNQAILDLERRFFAEVDGDGEFNLRALAEDWVRKVN